MSPLFLSERAIDFLVGVITGNAEGAPYRSGPQLVDFFNRFGEHDLYGSGFPSRHIYAREKINKLNGTDQTKPIVCAAFDFFDIDNLNPENMAFQFNRIVARDGWRLGIDHEPGWMQGSEYIEGFPYFTIIETTGRTIDPHPILLNSQSLAEHVSKARTKISNADYAGAITNCYTLIEEFLKIRLREAKADYPENEGDIRKLYKILSKHQGLEANEITPDPLKPILSGLSSIMSGFYEVANKGSDRHAAKFKASAHHAKLMVNVTFAFCEFLIESADHRSRV